MTELLSESLPFFSSLEALRNQMAKDSPLLGLQTKAWERFNALGLPQRKDEVFRYIKLRSLYSTSYASAAPFSVDMANIFPHVLPECRDSFLVTTNGHFEPSLSCLKGFPERMIVLPLKDAMQTYGMLLKNQAIKAIKEETDPFAALNYALQGETAFIYVPPKTICKAPLQIINLTEGKQGSLILPRLQLFVGAGSEIEIFNTHVELSSSDYFVNQCADMSIEENAHVRYVQLNCTKNDQLWHFDALRASLKRSSTLKTICVSNGSQTVRNDYRIQLLGENCEASLNGLCHLKAQRESHQHIFIDHQAPNCVSRQLFKGVLHDNSHSSFEGKIMVRQAAQETNAFQLNNNLLLSDTARAESKPNLEIFADNVKASHGATIGQLEQEELFYMKSRGFSDEAAKKLLVYGFCREIIDRIEHPSLHGMICQLLEA